MTLDRSAIVFFEGRESRLKTPQTLSSLGTPLIRIQLLNSSCNIYIGHFLEVFTASNISDVFYGRSCNAKVFKVFGRHLLLGISTTFAQHLNFRNSLSTVEYEGASESSLVSLGSGYKYKRVST